MDLQAIKEKLKFSWSADTAYGSWTPACPSLNQCAVTALVIQDYFCGDILCCKMTNNDTHYWNRLPNGQEEDLTESQFRFIPAKPLKSEFSVSTREYILSFPNTVIRYSLLKTRLHAILEEDQ